MRASARRLKLRSNKWMSLLIIEGSRKIKLNSPDKKPSKKAKIAVPRPKRVPEFQHSFPAFPSTLSRFFITLYFCFAPLPAHMLFVSPRPLGDTKNTRKSTFYKKRSLQTILYFKYVMVLGCCISVLIHFWKLWHFQNLCTNSVFHISIDHMI